MGARLSHKVKLLRESLIIMLLSYVRIKATKMIIVTLLYSFITALQPSTTRIYVNLQKPDDDNNNINNINNNSNKAGTTKLLSVSNVYVCIYTYEQYMYMCIYLAINKHQWRRWIFSEKLLEIISFLSSLHHLFSLSWLPPLRPCESLFTADSVAVFEC